MARRACRAFRGVGRRQCPELALQVSAELRVVRLGLCHQISQSGHSLSLNVFSDGIEWVLASHPQAMQLAIAVAQPCPGMIFSPADLRLCRRTSAVRLCLTGRPFNIPGEATPRPADHRGIASKPQNAATVRQSRQSLTALVRRRSRRPMELKLGPALSTVFPMVGCLALAWRCDQRLTHRWSVRSKFPSQKPTRRNKS